MYCMMDALVETDPLESIKKGRLPITRQNTVYINCKWVVGLTVKATKQIINICRIESSFFS